MNRNDAFYKWTVHLQKWITYLTSVKAECEEQGEQGSATKYDRQIRSLYDVMYGNVINPSLFESFIHPESIQDKPLHEVDFFNKNLSSNSPQREAVNKALNSDHLCLIQGPPGTGKTTVITEICLQILMRKPKSRILICSETHVAVNNVIDKLYEKLDDFHAIRIRNRESDPSDNIEESSTDAYLNQYFDRLADQGVRGEIQDMLKEVLSDESPSKRRQVEKALIQSKRVVGVTCNGISAYPFDPSDEPFDYVFIDEVCKATLPEILMPMCVAKKAILVGDPKQLPPLFCKEDVELMKETNTHEIEKYKYIDDLYKRVPSGVYSILTKQFRMTNQIGDMVSGCFYNEEGGLENGLDRSIPGSLKWADYNTNLRWPIAEGGPIYNKSELEIVEKILHLEEDKATKGTTVAVISPYRPMAKMLRNNIQRSKYDKLQIQIDTVDAFQGKDADVVLFCLTRNAGTLRFFSDPRRLNVALSRAKDQLWIIGNQSYAKGSKLLRDIIKRSDYYNINENAQG